MKLMHSLIAALACLLLFNGCGVYSFTGASIAPDVKSISIENFIDRSSISPPALSVIFSEKLREYYRRNTNLALLNEGGDLHLEGQITEYNVRPVAPLGNDVAGSTRLTIAVKAKFTNKKYPENDFDQTFSFFKDFSQNQSLSQVEAQFIDEITDQLVLDIFTKSVANW
jgi:hypothetical protein